MTKLQLEALLQDLDQVQQPIEKELENKGTFTLEEEVPFLEEVVLEECEDIF